MSSPTATGADHTCLVSVVGFTAHGNTYQSSTAGIGKSCLCSRFCYGGVDEYVSDHPSIMALHEFESQVVSTDHFLYWGPHSMSHPSKSGSKEVTVKYEVVEHTIFYHDETSQPFPNLRKLTVPRNYAKKIILPPESSRKISYYARDAIGFPDKYCCLPYPSNPSRLARGFLIAIDVSMKDYQFEYQLTAAETIVFELRKNVIVIAATKRDIACPMSMARLIEWAYKQKLTVIETSAKEDINVEDAFKLVAARVLTKKAKINDSYFDYAQGAGHRLKVRSQTRKDFKNHLRSFVMSSSVKMENIEANPAYQLSAKVLGKFVTDEILALHLLTVRNQELDSYTGMEDAEMRIEMLEDFIEGCSDTFGPHKQILYKHMHSLINPGQAVYVNETFISGPPQQPLTQSSLEGEDSPKSPGKSPAKSPKKSPGRSPEKYVKLVNQVYDSQEEEMTADCSYGEVEAPLSPTHLIEEVYDQFDYGQPPQNEDTKLTILSIKEKASLLKTQLSGTVVQVQDALQDKESDSTIVTSDDKVIPTVVEERGPPQVPSKPKGYEKWKIASKKEDSSSPLPPPIAPNTPPLLVSTPPPTKVPSTVDPPVVPSKPKGYQKWKLPNPSEPSNSNTSGEGGSKVSEINPQVLIRPQGGEGSSGSDIKPQVSPQVARKPQGYQKWKPVKTEDSTTTTSAVPAPPPPPDSKPKGYQKWTPKPASPLPPVPRKSYEKTVIKEAPEPAVGDDTKSRPSRANYSPVLPKLREKQRQRSLANSSSSSLDSSPSTDSLHNTVPSNYTPPALHRIVLPPSPPLSSPSFTSPPHPSPLISLPPPPPLPPPSTQFHTTPHPQPILLTAPNNEHLHQRPVSANVNNTSTVEGLSLPPPSTSRSFNSLSSPPLTSNDPKTSPSPPPIPPHTTQMFEANTTTSNENKDEKKKNLSNSPSKRHNYFNTILKSFKREKARSVDDGQPTSPPKRTVVNMRNRSLPAEPSQVPPMHEPDEYENPDQFLSHHNRPAMPLPSELQQTPLSSSSYPTLQDHFYDDPNISEVANPFLLNHSWIMNKKMEQGQLIVPPTRSPTFRDNYPMQQQTQNRLHATLPLPRRTQSFQVKPHIAPPTIRPNYYDDDDVDDDGYQKTDVIDEIRQARLPPAPSQSLPPASTSSNRRYSFEYDYPNIRGIRSLPPPQRRNVPLPPRSTDTSSDHRPLVKEESYVNMDIGGTDDYQNSEVIRAMVDTLSPKRLPPRSSQGSVDDMNIYYNLRDRMGLMSPPMITEESSRKPLVAPKPKAPSISSPPLLPQKKRSLTLADTSAFSTSKVLPQKEEDDLIDAETGQPKKTGLTLPPRNILRPGFNKANEYTPIY